MKSIIRFKKLKLFFNTVITNRGGFTTIHSDKRTEEILRDGFEECTISASISEIDFYKSFLFLKIGLAKADGNKTLESLTQVNVEHMALILSKPDTFVMPSLGRNSLQGDLAAESGRSIKSFYSSVTRLKNAGLLVVTEDNLIEPSSELKTLRRITKKHLDSLSVFPISYVVNFIVTKDNEPS